MQEIGENHFYPVLRLQTSRQAVPVKPGDADAAYQVMEILSGGVDLHVIGRMAGEQAVLPAFKQDALHGANQRLPIGATVNIMLAATLLPGQTIIENAAKEPHIVDLANFLNTMGARITGAGTDTVKIRGVNALRGGTYAIIPDPRKRCS